MRQNARLNTREASDAQQTANNCLQITTRAQVAADLSPDGCIGAGICRASGAHSGMDTTLNYAIGFVVLIGAAAFALALMVW
jgi:hypothetical protein